MDEPITIEETGFIPVGIKPLDGGEPTEVTIDLYQVNNRLVEIRDEFTDKPASEFNAAVAGYMVELGLPAVSHRTAIAFAKAIFARVDGLEKKVESPASATPTAS